MITVITRITRDESVFPGAGWVLLINKMGAFAARTSKQSL
jgi:hypothetical protein